MHTLTRLARITLLPFFTVACSSGSSGPSGHTDPPAFSLSVSPASVTLEPGTTEDLAITIARRGGFTGAVTVSAEGLPAGVIATATTIADAGSGVLALVAAPSAAAGQAQVTVRATTTVAGVTERSATTTVTVTALNPVPAITRIDPDEALAGGADFTLTVIGQGFVEGAEVRWNGATRSTSFGSVTQLTAAIPRADIAQADTAEVTVVNPAPGGGTSPAVSFAIVSDALDLDLDLDYTALDSAERTLLTGLDDEERAALSLWRTQVLAAGRNNGGLYFNVLNNPLNFAEAEVDVVRTLYNEEMAAFGVVNGKLLDQRFFAVTEKISGVDISALYENTPAESAGGPVNLNNLLTGNNGLGRFNNAVIRLWTNDLLDNGEMDGSITKFTLLSPFALDGIGDTLDLEDVKALLAADLASGVPDGTPLRLAFSDVLDAIYFGFDASSGSSIASVLSVAGIDQAAAHAIFAEWAERRRYDR